MSDESFDDGVEVEDKIDEDDHTELNEDDYYHEEKKEQKDFEGEYEKCFDDSPIEKDDSLQKPSEDDYEFDSIVGARDKRPVMAVLNKGKLSKQEMDELFVRD